MLQSTFRLFRTRKIFKNEEEAEKNACLIYFCIGLFVFFVDLEEFFIPPIYDTFVKKGFPGGSMIKNQPAKAGGARDSGSILV